MVLAADTSNMNGVVLLKQGTTLTEKHIKILKTWGITQVEIEGEESDTSLQEILDAHPEFVSQACHEASQLFLHVDQTHPLFVELIKHWKEQYIYREAGKK